MRPLYMIRSLEEGDVTAFFTLLQGKAQFDGCSEALLATEASGGTGNCGMRVVFRVEADRAAPLFRRNAH